MLKIFCIIINLFSMGKDCHNIDVVDSQLFKDSRICEVHEVCGLEATNIGGNDNYTVKTGLLVETNFYSSGFPMYHTSFKSFDDNPTTILTGDKYCSGKWIY